MEDTISHPQAALQSSWSKACKTTSVIEKEKNVFVQTPSCNPKFVVVTLV